MLFGHFMPMLNAAFKWKLALEEEGYESSSETVNMPTPLRKMPRIHHISSAEHASFDPNPVTPHNMFQTPPRLLCRWLTFSLSNDSDTSEDTSPAARETPTDAQVYLEDEVDFQMVPLDGKHWTTEEVPGRTLGIHEHAFLHGLCLYPCPYVNYLLHSYANTLDLSDISNFEDIMITSSNKNIPALEGAPHWKDWFELNIILTLIYSIN